MLIELSFMGLAAVSMRSALKYRRGWDKKGPTVQLLRKFMPRGSKGFRVYVPLTVAGASHGNTVVPLQVRLALRKAGFRVTDYRAKKCVKLNDKEQKNVFNIGKVIAKDPVAKAIFDNDPQLQNSSTTDFMMVVSCHPYDIIGMSTGRDWDTTSCMRLKDYREDYSEGINTRFLHHDVAEGTLVAYAIKASDSNIEKPLGRCLLKPFLRDDDSGTIFYRRETDIYGNPVPGFGETLNRFLRKLNAGVPAGIYKFNANLYDDGVGGHAEHEGSSGDNKVDWQIVDDKQKLTESPELFVDFAKYMINNNRNGVTDANVVINILIDAAKHIPRKHVKQAARLLAETDFAQAFYEHAASSYSQTDSKVIGKFLSQRDLKRAVMNAAKTAEAPDTLHALSFLGPEAAHQYFEEIKDSAEQYEYAAMCWVTGYCDLLPSDVESIPELHQYAYKFAELIREGSILGGKFYQASAHKVLSILKPYDGAYSVEILDNVARTLADDENTRPAVAAWLLNSLSANDTNRVSNLLPIIGDAQFHQMMRDRKFRKRVYALKDAPDDVKEIVAESIANMSSDYTPHDAERVRRELLAEIPKIGLDLVLHRHWSVLTANLPGLYPYVWYSQVKIDRIEIKRFVSHATVYMDYHHEHPDLKPLNEYQATIFKIVKSLMAVFRDDDRASTDAPPDPEVLSILREHGADFPGMEFLKPDLDKYPELLNAYTYKTYEQGLMSFVEDGGQKLLSMLRDRSVGGVKALLTAMTKDFRIGTVVSYAFELGHPITDEGAVFRTINSAHGQMHTVVAQFRRYVECIQKLEEFAHLFPDLGTLSEWQQLLPKMTEEELKYFNVISAKMRIMIKGLKAGVTMYLSLFEGAKRVSMEALTPPDWIKPKE